MAGLTVFLVLALLAAAPALANQDQEIEAGSGLTRPGIHAEQ